MLLPTEEEEIVSLIEAFESSGYAVTKKEVAAIVCKTLQLRRAARAVSGRAAAEIEPLSDYAVRLLEKCKLSDQPRLSNNFFKAFYLRNPRLGQTNAHKNMSPQRAMASTLPIRDLLFETRHQLATKLGLF